MSVAKYEVKTGIRDYLAYYPDKARILDDLKDEHQLKYGIAEYWDAKLMTSFSRNGVRLYTVFDEGFTPWYHVANKNWYHDGGKGANKDPVFNYILTDGFKKTSKLNELFGTRMDTIFNNQGTVVIKVPEFKFEKESRQIYLIGR